MRTARENDEHHNRGPFGIVSLAAAVRIASIVLAVAIVAIVLFLLRTNQQLHRANEDVNQSARLLAGANRLERLLLDLETGQRGFVISQDETFLEPYGAALEALDTVAPRVVELAGEDSLQLRRAEALREGIDAYIDDYSDATIEIARSDPGAAAARVSTGEGKDRVDELRTQFEALTTTERERILARSERADSLARRAQIGSMVAVAAILASLLAFYLFVSRAVVRPLVGLRDVVGRIAGGDLTARAETTYMGEAQDLAMSLGDMAEQLAAAQAVLEHRRQEIEEHALALERSNQDLEQFAYAAAHDLQEPLRMVASYTGLIERRYKGQLDDDADEFIKYAVDGAKRMQRLINDLLQYSRVGSTTSKPEFVPLAEAAHSALVNLEARVRDRDARVELDINGEVIVGDRGQLTMLLQNLLGNALRYAHDDAPRVALHARRDGDRIVLSVDDDGPGIEPEYRDKVFRIFQRLGPRDEHAGTGIGLALCRRIVERHGGEIHIETAPIGGARFCFDLPAATKDH